MTHEGFRIEPLAGYIGANVTDISLTGPVPPAISAGLRSALSAYKVLFFPGQSLSHDQHVAFASAFGSLAPSHPFIPSVPGYPQIHRLITGGPQKQLTDEQAHRAHWRRPGFLSGWHCDLTPLVNPPSCTVLRAQQVTSRGGDTIWGNLVTAYEALSEPLRRLADQLTAEHRYLVGYVPYRVYDEYTDTIKRVSLIARHPLVRLIPQTGERAIFVNPSFTSHIVELQPAESTAILDLLYDHITRPEFAVRFRWANGSVAVWDNTATVHLGPEDHEHFGEQRIMYRVFVAGAPLVGPKGQVSSAVCGEPYPTL